MLETFPAGTETHDATLPSGLRMRWYARGPEDGPTAILLHGFPELAVSWREQLADLSDQFRVVAPDMRGYGGTAAPRAVRDYRVSQLVGDVTGLIELLGAGPVHLAGHDWGGAVAWEVARRAGERLRSLAVLNCPPVDVLLRAAWRPAQLLKSWYILFFQLPRLPERSWTNAPDRSIRRAFRGTAVNKRPFTDAALQPYIDQLRERGLPGINYYRAALRNPSLAQRPVRVPVRVIWGDQDAFLGPWLADARAYRKFVTDIDIVRIHDSGHWVQQEAPIRVNAALREHWERVDRGGPFRI